MLDQFQRYLNFCHEVELARARECAAFQEAQFKVRAIQHALDLPDRQIDDWVFYYGTLGCMPLQCYENTYMQLCQGHYEAPKA